MLLAGKKLGVWDLRGLGLWGLRFNIRMAPQGSQLGAARQPVG